MNIVRNADAVNEITVPVVGPHGEFRAITLNKSQESAGQSIIIWNTKTKRVDVLQDGWTLYEDMCLNPNRIGLSYEPEPQWFEQWRSLHAQAEANKYFPIEEVKDLNERKLMYHPEVYRRRGLARNGAPVVDLYAMLGVDKQGKTKKAPAQKESI